MVKNNKESKPTQCKWCKEEVIFKRGGHLNLWWVAYCNNCKKPSIWRVSDWIERQKKKGGG